MKTDDDWPTKHLCSLLAKIPDELHLRYNLLHKTCLALDKHPTTRAGVEPSMDRPIGEFIQPLALADLHGRISELVDAGFDQQLLVMGVLSFVDSRLAEWSDPGAAAYARQERIEMIEYFERLRAQPEETTRRLPMSDGEVDNTIARLPLESPEEAEAYRQEAERALAVFRAERERFFSPVYWYRHGGSTSYQRESGLAECWRDLHVVAQRSRSCRSGTRSAAGSC